MLGPGAGGGLEPLLLFPMHGDVSPLQVLAPPWVDMFVWNLWLKCKGSACVEVDVGRCLNWLRHKEQASTTKA
jgi:hypothetical protein